MEFLDDLTLSVGRKKGTGNFCELSLTGVSGSICKTQKTRGNGNQTQKWRR